jgi:hypothetical protein
MTDEMLELARANAVPAGVENVEFVKGYIEDTRWRTPRSMWSSPERAR